MSKRMKLVGAVSVIAAPGLLVLTAGPSHSATAMPSCPTTATLSKTGSQTSYINKPNTNLTWNLTGAVWNSTPTSAHYYPVRSDAFTKGCIVGGSVDGGVPRAATRDQWYNGEDGGTRLGGEGFRQTLTKTAGNWAVLRNTSVSNIEDAYDPNTQDASHTYYLDHVRAEMIRDDCLENEGTGTAEKPMNVVIKNSMFDGCFTGFAERPTWSNHGAPNGSGPSSLTVENSLMYVNPQPLGSNYCDSTKVQQGRCAQNGSTYLGAHGIWKWSEAAASKVTIRNSVFRLDMPSYTGCAPQVWPAGTYENVKVVWTGKGSYATAGGCKNVLPPGVTLTTDKSVWDNAKAKWLSGSSSPARSSTSATPATARTTSAPGAKASAAVPTAMTARAKGHRVSGTLATGTGKRISGARVTLQRRTASGWTKVISKRTGDHGAVRTTVSPRKATSYRWSYRGAASHPAATSRAVRVIP
jgi:hypothetical protein